VRTGENAFRATNGVDAWTWRRDHPQENAIFNQNMTVQTTTIAGAVAEAYDFAGMSTVVDVGGGQGSLLEAVLTRHPQLTGTVFDQEHVVATEPAAAGLAPRWAAASGSFFESVPEADALVLKSILHDWPDHRCVEILDVCARSLRPGGAVLVVERLLGRPGFEVDAAFSDLNMLVSPGGQERTEPEYTALLEAAGFTLTRVIPTRGEFSLIEGRTASASGLSGPAAGTP
jgi:hypothetical protein